MKQDGDKIEKKDEISRLEFYYNCYMNKDLSTGATKGIIISSLNDLKHKNITKYNFLYLFFHYMNQIVEEMDKQDMKDVLEERSKADFNL